MLQKGYSNFLGLDEVLSACADVGDDEAAYIAEIQPFQVVRQRFGSYGYYGRSFSGGEVSGVLDHTPIVSPAVIGEITLY